MCCSNKQEHLHLTLWVDNVLFASGKEIRGVLTEKVVAVALINTEVVFLH